MTSTEHFEDRLLRELQAVVSAQPALAPARPSHQLRNRLTVGAGTVAAATAGAFALTAGSTPAYAVTDHGGTVTVTISSLKDAAGLQKALKADGVNAVVDYTPLGKMCQQPRGQAPSTDQPTKSGVRTATSGAVTFMLDPGQLGTDDTLVIETSGGDDASSVGISVVTGAVSPCTLVPAPTPPAPGAPSGSGSGTGPSLQSGTGIGQTTTAG